MMVRRGVLFSSLVLVTMQAACGSSTGKTSSSQPATGLSFAKLQEGTLEGYFPATLTIIPERSSLQIALSAGQADQAWWLQAILDKETVLAGTAVLPILNADGGGERRVSVGRGSGLQATSGSLSLEIGNGKVSGTVTTGSSELDASFWATLSVSCWVPHSLLPNSNSGSGSGGDTEASVEDTKLETAPCAPYQGLSAL